MHNKNSNIYDKLITFYLILQVFGGYGGPFQPIRIFIVICLPFLISFFLTNKKVLKCYRYEILTFTIWIIYGIISLLWVLVPSEGLKEIIYLFINFAGFLLLLSFSNAAKNPQKAILKGWVILFIITIPIALNELLFDTHLSIAFQPEDMHMNFGKGVIMQRRFASVTFGNLNGYNTVLTYILPFLIGSLMGLKKKVLLKIFLVSLIVLISVIIILNSSRAAFVCLMIVLFSLILFQMRSLKSIIISGLVFLAIISFLLFSQNQIFEMLFMRFQAQGFSDEGRADMIFIGLNELVNSYFMGIGAGDFMPTMENKYQLDNSSSHNFFLEILVQYGLIIFILFIGIFVRIFKSQKNNPFRKNKFIIITSLCMYPVATIIDSSYLLSVQTWIFIGSLLIIADMQYINTVERK